MEKSEAKQWPGNKEERVDAASLPNSKVSCSSSSAIALNQFPASQART
jgi:hypothetical protein